MVQHHTSHADVVEAEAQEARAPDSNIRTYVDPLAADAPGDELVVTTARERARVALVASEVSRRFALEGVSIEPMVWMTAPRRLFGGRTALEACARLDACKKALVLHNLGLGLDANPDELHDALADDGDDLGPDASKAAVVGGASASSQPWRLYTATLSRSDASGHVQAFAAVVSRTPQALLDLLRSRHGHSAAAEADILVGFDPGLPMAEALVSPAMAHTLSQVAADPTSPLARGLDVLIEQRFEA